MKTIILGGFLGSGKTTVLIQLASYLRERTGRTEGPSVVVLENEISEAGVDNQLLARKNFTVENIFAGCICCSSSGPLKESVKKIHETYNPDFLLIEATGMAYPDNIRETLEEESHISAGIFALADAARWKRVKRAMPDFVTSQLIDAKVIFLTKIDLAGPETTAEAAEDIAAYNREAKLYPINALEPIPAETWEEALGLLSAGEEEV